MTLLIVGTLLLIPTLYVVAWAMRRATADIVAADIARITGGWHLDEPEESEPAPARDEPLRRIDWIVDDTLARILREATDELFWIKAVEPVCA